MTPVIDSDSLRSIREARGWDQAALARLAGVDASVLSRLERGLQQDLNASILIRLARTLETPVESLLSPPDATTTPAVEAELIVMIRRVVGLSRAQQRHIAAIMRAYVNAYPEQE